MAKRFFYVCGGILMLALAYHFGATSARAQAGSTGFTGMSVTNDGWVYVMTPNADVYRRLVAGAGVWQSGNPSTLVGNFWDGGATSAQPTSFGALKAKYR
jgi:hypothetical protein